MRIVGINPADGPVFDCRLRHGEDPALLSFDRGFAVLGPLDTSLSDGEIILRLRVEPVNGRPRPTTITRHADDLVLVPGEQLQVRQRIAAYAVVTSDRGLLATEYSELVRSASGQWGLPGGGIDPHETPQQAVVREVFEETGQLIELGALISFVSGHFIGRAPDGTAEDFHTLRLVFRADAPAPTEPVVHDVGGTTASARWLPLHAWDTVPWTSGWLSLLRNDPYGAVRLS